MNDKKKASWQQKKQNGSSKYLIKYGLLPWGLGLTLFFGLIEYLSVREVIWNWIPVRLFVFTLAGFFIANSRWNTNERLYGDTLTERP